MEIRRVPIEKIKDGGYNPRKALKPTDHAYKALEKSIREFGMVEVLVWNERTGNLVGGQQRLNVLREKGAESVLVSVVDLDLDREKALNLALNRIDGEWDQSSLDSLIASLDEDLLGLTGFESQEIDDMLLKVEITDEEIESVMGKAVERTEPTPPDERITVTLMGSPEELTEERIGELRALWAPRGVAVRVKR